MVQIASRHLAASMAMLRRPDASDLEPAVDRLSPLPSVITSIIKHYPADESVFIDDKRQRQRTLEEQS